MKTIVSFILVIANIQFCVAQESYWSEVESVFDKKGAVQDGVYKITFPRSDLKVKVGDFQAAPGLAFTSWVAFIGMESGNMAMMMGDLVLLDTEVKPVISKIVSSGLEVTAIHNHIVNETPAIKYVHFSGKGEAANLAKAIKSVFEVTGTLLAASSPQKQAVTPDWSKVEAVLGAGNQTGNLLKYSFPRNEKLTESGMEMPPSMGMATAIGFQIEGNQAAITGDFVLLADEVNPVVRELTANGISVTALHNHMLYDDPRLFMMHFWAVDDPEKLAKGLKAALDKTNSKSK